ncbi:MAG: PPC domain-containing protein [Anaerolineae bacterium]|nr:PPC domain-containing protein [Anaerolineae bacterium]
MFFILLAAALVLASVAIVRAGPDWRARRSSPVPPREVPMPFADEGAGDSLSTWRASPQGEPPLSVTLRLPGQVSFPERKPVAAPAGMTGWFTLMTEGFEGAFPSGFWQVGDFSSGSVGYTWGKRSCLPHSGSFSAWSAGGGINGAGLACGGNYVDNMWAWMIWGPFSLASAVDVQVSFWYNNNSEPGGDYLRFGASEDGYNFYMASASGDSGGWQEANYNLSNWLGKNQVWIGFLFSSNASFSTYPGAFVDDIRLQINLPATPTPTPTATPLPPGAEFVVLQQGANGYTGARDTHLDRYQANSPRGSATNLYLYIDSSGEVRSVLVDFDLGGLALPRDAQVLEANLLLYQHKFDSAGVFRVAAYALNRAWDEYQATWSRANNSTLWSGAGANGVPWDRQGVGTALETLAASRGWKRWNVTGIVQDWVRAPEQHFGLKLLADGTPSGAATIGYFYSGQEEANPTLRPKLELVFIRATPTDTPTATPTDTPSPTLTHTPTWTHTPTPTPRKLHVHIPVFLYGLTPTPTPTPTIPPTWTPTPTPTFTAPPVDPYEPNDRFSQATPIPPGETIYGLFPPPNDEEDFYHFTTTVTATLEGWLWNIPVGSNYNLVLYNEAKNLVEDGYSGNAGNANEHVQVGVQPPGKYYVRVYRGEGPPTLAKYSLCFEYGNSPRCVHPLTTMGQGNGTPAPTDTPRPSQGSRS